MKRARRSRVSSDRDRVLAQIKQALGKVTGEGIQPPRNHTASSPEWLGEGEPWSVLRNELELLSDRFHMAESEADLQRILEHIIGEHGVSLAVRWEHPLLESIGIDQTLGALGVTVEVPAREGEWKELSAKAQLGITAVDAVIVESGTLVLRSSKEQGRALSLLPPVHVAIVEPARRLRNPDSLSGLCRWWAEGPNGLPSAVTLITGHSRTADIEMTLVSGVHGPGMVHVIGLGEGYVREESA